MLRASAKRRLLELKSIGFRAKTEFEQETEERRKDLQKFEQRIVSAKIAWTAHGKMLDRR